MMTPELKQALKILQLSSLELKEYVDQILLENPLIEIVEEENTGHSEERKDQEIDWEKYLRDNRENRNYEVYNGMREIKEDVSLENMIAHAPNLHEHLLSQLGCLRLNFLEQKVGQYLIGNINPLGYLTVSIEQVAHDLRVSGNIIEKVLQYIQNFEPAGVGARDLRECLKIQLKQQNVFNEDLEQLIDQHLENLGEGKYNKVAAAMNLSVQHVQELADIIKKLNPKPGASIGTDDSIRYISPDIFVERVGEEYVILLNERLTPRLTISQSYTSLYQREGVTDDKTKNYVESKLNQALWVIRSIEQRKMTIYRIAQVLLKKQREFFDKGIKYLQPLTLKQVANELDIHESTVSRATTNKYMQTPHGIFELKFFFCTGYKTKTGDSASAESIKKMLQEIVKKEDPSQPYSDQELAEIMQKKGFSIARRTITKYRHELGILNRGQRKRY